MSLNFSTKDRPFEEFFVARKDRRSLKLRLCFPDPPHRLNQKFPNVVLFCFPDRPIPRAQDPPMKALRFTFVLTNEFGRRLFGHALQLLSGDLICFISKFCWVRFFDDVLYQFRMNGENLNSIIAFYHSIVPSSNSTFHSPSLLSLNHSIKTSGVPPPKHHNTNNTSSSSASPYSSSISATSSPNSSYNRNHHMLSTTSTASSSNENDYYSDPIQSVAEGLRRPGDSGNVFADVRLGKALEFMSNDVLLRVIAALMCEGRVVIVGRRVFEISDAVLALVALLQPFVWEHVLVPVLPTDLLDVLCSPTPFLIGVLGTQLQASSKLPIEDVVTVVLGREGSGGEGSFIRYGIPSMLPEIRDEVKLVFAKKQREATLSQEEKEQEKRLLQRTNSTITQRSTAILNPQHALPTELDEPDDDLYYQFNYMIMSLPYTESSLCSLRVGLFQARRKTDVEEMVQTLLAAFHDFYVFTFGLAFAPDFTPESYFIRMISKSQASVSHPKSIHEYSSSQKEDGEYDDKSGSNNNNVKDNNNNASDSSFTSSASNEDLPFDGTREFFERVAHGMMMSEVRGKFCENLEHANQAAIQIKKQQLQLFEQTQRATADYYFSESNNNNNNNTSYLNSNNIASAAAASSSSSQRNNNMGTMSRGHSRSTSIDTVVAIESAHPHFSFKPTISDVYHIKRIIDSEFLEACLERYPLLYPHAAQVLARAVDAGDESHASSRTVEKLEDSSSLLRRFASWMSYGVTSTVQKLTTSGKNVHQTRAELEEL